MDNALIVLNDISKSYAIAGMANPVLRQISLCIEAGEMVAIVGASGSGKSTLMNIIGLLDKADSGQYFLLKRNMASVGEEELAQLRNQRIGFVFQQFNLLPRFTAKQNVALPLIYANVAPAEIDERVMRALSRVGMSEFAAHRPNQLSGGQQQRVAIARALINEPQVILADEPTGALDSKTGAEVMKLFHTLNREGRTLIIITHDEHIAAQCRRRIVLVDGRIARENNHELV